MDRDESGTMAAYYPPDPAAAVTICRLQVRKDISQDRVLSRHGAEPLDRSLQDERRVHGHHGAPVEGLHNSRRG